MIIGKIVNITIEKAPNSEKIVDIFQKFNTIAGPHFTRDSEFLDWRFNDGPLFKGRIYWVSVKGKHIGYFVLKKIDINNIDFLAIMDVIFCRPLTILEKIGLKLLIACIGIQENSDSIFTLNNSNNKCLKWLSSFPFVRIPDKFLPHSTPIFTHFSSEVFNCDVLGGTFYTLADLDYF